MRRALWWQVATIAAQSSTLGPRIRSRAAAPIRGVPSRKAASAAARIGRKTESGGMAVPTVPYTGEAAWYGRDLAKDEARWIHRFTEEEIALIDRAVDGVLARRVPIEATTKADFDFGPFNDVLARVLHQVVHGIGFILFRGLPVQRYTLEKSALAYWGIGLHLGRPVSQNAKGHLIGHVRDIGHDPNNPTHRKYATNARQIFHTDSTDIVGLLCLRTAKTGGLSSLSSSVTVFNEIIKVRPDIAQRLAEPWYYDRKGEVPPGKQEYYQLAIQHHHDGMVSTIFARDFIDSCMRFPEIPRQTPLEVEALDMALEVAGRDDVCLHMELAPGDIQFLHNHQILHARTAYEDWPEEDKKRHLLRLWLTPPNGRPLPDAFAERYGSTEIGNRGGIKVVGFQPKVTLVPE